MKEIIGTVNGKDLYLVGLGSFGAEVLVGESNIKRNLVSLYKFTSPVLTAKGAKLLDEIEKYK